MDATDYWKDLQEEFRLDEKKKEDALKKSLFEVEKLALCGDLDASLKIVSSFRLVRKLIEELCADTFCDNVRHLKNEYMIELSDRYGDEEDDVLGEVYDYMLRGEDVSGCAKLLTQVNNEEDKDKAAEIGRLWIEAMGDPEKEDKFTGVDSPSFKVRFSHWLR